jgi:hypothetical protein
MLHTALLQNRLLSASVDPPSVSLKRSEFNQRRLWRQWTALANWSCSLGSIRSTTRAIVTGGVFPNLDAILLALKVIRRNHGSPSG